MKQRGALRNMECAPPLFRATGAPAAAPPKTYLLRTDFWMGRDRERAGTLLARPGATLYSVEARRTLQFRQRCPLQRVIRTDS